MSPEITAAIVVTVILAMHVFVFLGCICAILSRMNNTGYEHSPHVLAMAWALFKAVFKNEIFSVTDNKHDELTEMVVGFYLYGFSAGKNKITLTDQDFISYACRCKEIKPFHSLLVRLLRTAYANGVASNVRKMSHR